MALIWGRLISKVKVIWESVSSRDFVFNSLSAASF